MCKAHELRIITKLIILLIFVCQFTLQNEIVCDRAPDGHVAQKSPPDGRYRLKISGNPENYTPNENYKIVLAGIQSINKVHRFSGFLLVVEKSTTGSDSFVYPVNGNTGKFHLYGDSLTTFSEKCKNAVTETSTTPKTEVQVMWTAPPAGSGCVIFRATVIEHHSVWYMDDDPLTKVFCEDEQDTIDKQPLVVDPCCACEEAKYELTFERIWSRHTHPKNFPPDSLSTKFSDIIGASHTVDYRFWEYGAKASEGLQQVAEHGSTRMLEGELKDESEHIRTIIKARGVSFPNVTGKTFAVFRVDSKHHLISLVSMIDPSPDWIVGVAGMELCLANCTWVEQKKLSLYPWDAGTDSGPSYISPDQPTNPADVIRRIKSNFPNDPRSPFYDESGSEMKPMAKLSISRQRLYEKNCENNQNQIGVTSNKATCETNPWGEWSECNAKCGPGKRHRQKTFKDPIAATRAGCKTKLTQKENCVGEEAHCSDNENTENLQNIHQSNENTQGPECALTEWTSWSSCTSACGKGTRTRYRQYVMQRAAKKCQKGLANPLSLEENDECYGQNCTGDINPEEVSNKNCKVSQWSQWSVCSVSCGLGQQVRKRHILKGRNAQNRKQRHSLKAKKRVQSYDNTEDNGNEEENNEDPCSGISLHEEVVCGYDHPDCPIEDLSGIPEKCLLEPKVGHCRSNSVNRWIFDVNKNDCVIIFHSGPGCGGNANNFGSREECLETCKRPQKNPRTKRFPL